MLLQKLDHILILIVNRICKWSAAPAIFRIDFGAAIKEQPDDISKALAGGDMEGGPTVNIFEVNIGARVQELLNPFQIPLVSHVH